MYNNNSEDFKSLDCEKVVGAFLGAACGDALGWPFEGHSKERPNLKSWRGGFLSWRKVSGWRFKQTSEHIAPGEYSDDTQLILALTRSRLKFEHWWLDFALVELPFWTTYERGGGGATKRAALSWLSGVPPWHSAKSEQITSYFSAGGNGVAMRVLPHCVIGARSETFSETARNIITDGVITHGHPRALVGALAYGHALWRLFRKNDTLQFGELIDDLIASVCAWGSIQNIDPNWPDWRETAFRYNQNYLRTWDQTVEEMMQLLQTVKAALEEGALTADESLLGELGALTTRTNGAGTVTCAAALYFASRYAATPNEGLVYAASSVGADTDTLASMTAALLGALAGDYWLRTYTEQLQDFKYINEAAIKLRNLSNDLVEYSFLEVTKSTLTGFSRALAEGALNKGDALPNGQCISEVTDVSNVRLEESAKKLWQISTVDGLTLYIKTVPVKQKLPVFSENLFEQSSRNSVLSVGISLQVANLLDSRNFYEKILGMSVVAESSRLVRFENNIVVQRASASQINPTSVTIFVQVSNLDAVYSNLLKLSAGDLGAISLKGRTKTLEVRDPDGHLIELYERAE